VVCGQPERRKIVTVPTNFAKGAGKIFAGCDNVIIVGEKFPKIRAMQTEGTARFLELYDLSPSVFSNR
jgi:hypothetical protein